MAQKWFGRFLPAALLLISSLFFPSRVCHAGCAGGAACARSDKIQIEIFGMASVSGTLFGYTGANYEWPAKPSPDRQTSCLQPGMLATQRFEFAGDLPGLGPARLSLDPERRSGGQVLPQSLPQDAASIPAGGGFFPAVNEMTFFLRLDLPDLGLHLVNIQPLTVRAVVGSWPPPEGTVYELQKGVQFAQRDPLTGKPVGPALAKLKLGSHAFFHPPGPLEVTLEPEGLDGDTMSLIGRLTAQATPLHAVWQLYSRGTIAVLGEPIPAAPEFGPQAGRADLSPGVPQKITLPVRMAAPGSEVVTLMVAAQSGDQIFGGRSDLRVVLPDRGLRISAVTPEVATAGSQRTVILSGEGFEAPVSLNVSALGITVGAVTLVSPQEVRAEIDFTAAPPGSIDVMLTSNGRQFTYADALTVLWPPPVIRRVRAAPAVPDQRITFQIEGDFFLTPSSVGLGPHVEVLSVRYVSRNLLSVTARPAAGFPGPVDVVVVAANGSTALVGGLTVTP